MKATLLFCVFVFCVFSLTPVHGDAFVRFINISGKNVTVTTYLQLPKGLALSPGTASNWLNFGTPATNFAVNVSETGTTLLNTLPFTSVDGSTLVVILFTAPSTFSLQSFSSNFAAPKVGTFSATVLNFLSATGPLNTTVFSQSNLTFPLAKSSPPLGSGLLSTPLNVTFPLSPLAPTTPVYSLPVVVGFSTNNFTGNWTGTGRSGVALLFVLWGSGANVKILTISLFGIPVTTTFICNQMWTITNREIQTITIKYDWRPRKTRFSLSIPPLSSSRLVISAHNGNSRKLFLYQGDGDGLKQQLIQNITHTKCVVVNSICRGKYSIQNLANDDLPLIYQSFSRNIAAGTLVSLTNPTTMTLAKGSTVNVTTNAQSSTFLVGFLEAFKVWLSVDGLQSRKLATFYGSVQQGNKCT